MRRRQDAPFFKGTFFFAAADQVTPNLRADERCAAGRQKIKWLGERKTGCLLLCRLSDGSLCVVSKSGTGRLFPDGLISSTSLSLFLPNFSDDDKWEASWLHNDTRKIKRCFHFFPIVSHESESCSAQSRFRPRRKRGERKGAQHISELMEIELLFTSMANSWPAARRGGRKYAKNLLLKLQNPQREK